MSDGETLSRQPDFRHHIDRVISAPEGKQADEVLEEAILPAMVSELNRRNKGLAGKLNTLEEVIKTGSKDSIPVHPEAREVIQALRILHPSRGEKSIFLDQYLNALEYEFSRADVDPINLSGMLTGNTEIDSRILDRESWPAYDCLDTV